MNRTRNTLYLAVVSSASLLLTTASSLIIGRLILIYLGSDYNGLNGIVTQFLTVITLIEGGFTTASLVTLLKPYLDKDFFSVNQLISETTYKFHKIGKLAMLIGSVSALIYSLFLNTEIPYVTIVSILIISLCGSVFKIAMVTKYRLIFQAAQEEYIYNFILLCSNIVTYALMILVLLKTKNIILMRSAQLLGTVIFCLAARKIFYLRYPKIVTNCWDGKNRIQGTNDVMIGKIVGVIHSSSTTIFLSLFSSVALTSVYSVYQSVFNIVSSVVNIFISSPQNALGQILQEGKKENTEHIVIEFEYIVILVLSLLFIPLFIALLPFVKIYTSGVNDIEYVNYKIALMLFISTYIQLLHIPSGLCIYMSGRFKTAKTIQLIALVILISSNLILGGIFGVYGILFGMMLCNIAFAVMEIGYVHFKMMPKLFSKFLIRWIPNVLFTVILIVIFMPLGESFITDFFTLIVFVLLMILVCALLLGTFNFIILKKPTKALIQRVKRIFVKK